jgi:hypothetical protein
MQYWHILSLFLFLSAGHQFFYYKSAPPAGLRPSPYQKFQLNGHAQGTTWQITYYNPDSISSRSKGQKAPFPCW